jgi:hypothetical protein
LTTAPHCHQLTAGQSLRLLAAGCCSALHTRRNQSATDKNCSELAAAAAAAAAVEMSFLQHCVLIAAILLSTVTSAHAVI